jgi:hypothetical protein
MRWTTVPMVPTPRAKRSSCDAQRTDTRISPGSDLRAPANGTLEIDISSRRSHRNFTLIEYCGHCLLPEGDRKPHAVMVDLSTSAPYNIAYGGQPVPNHASL